MGTKSREVIWNGRIMGAEIRARDAREAAQKAEPVRQSVVRSHGRYGGPAQPSPTIDQCLRLGWLEIKCSRCETKASIPLNAIRRPRDTPIWYLLGRSGFEAEKLLPGCGEFPHDQHFSEASRRGDIEKIVSVWIQAEIWLAGLIGRHIADAANSAAINNLG